ncbi:hypothetical protein Strain138_002769 [Pseudogemmatithrix spongiicola]|uniref:Uncharacterized protein n=1 Tax=Pseudogemmatithrix spongiicola TaxID=3062599 RepID=A0AA49K2E0_9BACT|nr:hypothetical protein Strain138_002769 [Gemmatimonadaceae bacterium 'strain 138']WKW16356.1 hypothetical protein Strain318_002769 [Gemmatimonadaceae bacterium 'strain 318']
MPRHRSFVCAAVALWVAACVDDAPTAADAGINPALLTPEVAAQLDARGMFPLQQPEAGYINPRSRSDADSLARRAIASQAAEYLIQWQMRRGAAIDIGRLERCGPILYSASAYEVAMMTPQHLVRQEVGGRYEMVFCGPDGRRTLYVSVPIEEIMVESEAFGDLANVLVAGIPIAGEHTELPSPEEAARIAAKRTGRRVASVPERVNTRFRWPTSRYMVRLDRPVAVHGLGSFMADTISVVFVGSFWSDDGEYTPLTALRPFRPATESSRVDTLPYTLVEGCSLCLYTARIGMPRWAEPFSLRAP